METNNITPGDEGFLMVCLDDCISSGLGDDDTVERLEVVCDDLDIDTSVAYKFFRNNLK